MVMTDHLKGISYLVLALVCFLFLFQGVVTDISQSEFQIFGLDDTVRYVTVCECVCMFGVCVCCACVCVRACVGGFVTYVLWPKLE